MTRDDVRKIFPEASEQQIDSILNGIGAEINPLKNSLGDVTGQLNAANAALSASQASETALKAQVEDLTSKVNEGMTAEERIAALQKEAEDSKREYQLKSNSLDAKEILVGAGITGDQLDALLGLVVSDDAEATKKAAQAIVDFDAARAAAVEQATKDAVLKSNPKPNGGGSEGGVSREEFMKLSYADQMAALEENPDLLKTFKQ